MDKKSGPEKKDALRYQEEILDAALALDSISGNLPPDHALGLLRDAARAEEAMVEYLAARIVQAQPGDAAWVGQLRPMVLADVFHIASDFIKAAPAAVNPFLASAVKGKVRAFRGAVARESIGASVSCLQKREA